MINEGKIIVLRGKTLKGKNRIREHGEKWRVKKIAKDHPFVPDGHLFLESLTRDWRGQHDNRWIDPLRDQHFEIIPANENNLTNAD